MNNENNNNLKRSPVIVVVGHVDHGKTSLLDYIRQTNVVAKEAGSITQATGAYEIEHNKEKITFIDTPGHEAFSKMRVRGTRVADIAILVVAADESVKPQTQEAIKVLQESKTPFMVAITKIDKPSADIEKVKNDLTANGVLLEGYGGDISYQGISSKNGEGIGELLDHLLLVAEVEDLKYNPNALASGMVLEARMDSRRGNSVSVILKDGKLKKGDMIVTTTAKGKIKILENFLGETVSELIPSSPAIIMGFENLPTIGEEFKSGDLSKEDIESVKASDNKKFGTVSEAKKDQQVLRLILKADVAGSLEAINDVLKNITLKTNQTLEIVSKSVGEITDGDIKDAISTGAIIVGFGVKTNKAAENLARAQSINVVTDKIIYKLVENIQDMFTKMSDADKSSELEILATFSASANKQTIGGRVVKGQLKNKSKFEILREDKLVGSGKILNLQQGKKDAPIVNAGDECGLVIDTGVEVQKGDKLITK